MGPGLRQNDLRRAIGARGDNFRTCLGRAARVAEVDELDARRGGQEILVAPAVLALGVRQIHPTIKQKESQEKQIYQNSQAEVRFEGAYVKWFLNEFF